MTWLRGLVHEVLDVATWIMEGGGVIEMEKVPNNLSETDNKHPERITSHQMN